MKTERLQKVMARAGIASRRDCETLIEDGRVKVNGRVVTELGTKVDPDRDIVLVDDQAVTGHEASRYVLLYKPRGYLSDTESQDGRPCLADLVHVPQRLYPVGRLDFDSEGLMLLTNDGDLAHKLTHPRFEHPKEYIVLVEGKPGPIALRKLRHGIDLADGKTAPAEISIIDGPPPFLAQPTDVRSVPTTWLRMTLREGRKREIRHMTAAVGHATFRLIRVGLGPLRLVRLKPGQWRDVTSSELRQLRRVARNSAPRGTPRKPVAPSATPVRMPDVRPVVRSASRPPTQRDASPARANTRGGAARPATATRSSRPPFRRDAQPTEPTRSNSRPRTAENAWRTAENTERSEETPRATRPSSPTTRRPVSRFPKTRTGPARSFSRPPARRKPAS